MEEVKYFFVSFAKSCEKGISLHHTFISMQCKFFSVKKFREMRGGVVILNYKEISEAEFYGD